MEAEFDATRIDGKQRSAYVTAVSSFNTKRRMKRYKRSAIIEKMAENLPNSRSQVPSDNDP